MDQQVTDTEILQWLIARLVDTEYGGTVFDGGCGCCSESYEVPPAMWARIEELKS